MQAKGAIAIAMHKHLAQHELAAFDLLRIFAEPYGVRARKEIGKDGLQLVLASERVGTTAGKNSIPVGTFDITGKQVEYYVEPQIRLPVDKHGEVKDKPWVAHAWLVDTSSDPREANMVLHFVEERIGQFTVRVPLLKPKRKIKADEPLVRFVEAGDDDAEEPATKKQKQ